LGTEGAVGGRECVSIKVLINFGLFRPADNPGYHPHRQYYSQFDIQCDIGRMKAYIGIFLLKDMVYHMADSDEASVPANEYLELSYPPACKQHFR
jgi:hypothetical protein